MPREHELCASSSRALASLGALAHRAVVPANRCQRVLRVVAIVHHAPDRLSPAPTVCDVHTKTEAQSLFLYDYFYCH